jgi:hypothetical protein
MVQILFTLAYLSLEHLVKDPEKSLSVADLEKPNVLSYFLLNKPVLLPNFTVPLLIFQTIVNELLNQLFFVLNRPFQFFTVYFAKRTSYHFTVVLVSEDDSEK